MGVGTLGASIIRTVVPVLVGSLLGWLVTLGIEFDPETREGIVQLFIGLVTAVCVIVYYVVVRLIETRFPKIGVLLGLRKAPTNYANADAVQEIEAEAAPAPASYGAVDAGTVAGTQYGRVDASDHKQETAVQYIEPTDGK